MKKYTFSNYYDMAKNFDVIIENESALHAFLDANPQFNTPDSEDHEGNVIKGEWSYSFEDISEKINLEKKFNSDDESDKLCLKAYKLVKFHNRKFASKESLMSLMQNQQAMWLLLFLLGGSPDLALGLIQQMDKQMYPEELIKEVSDLLMKAILITKEKND